MYHIKQIIFSDVMVGDEKVTFTLTEFHEKYAVDEALLLEMLEYGLIEPDKAENLIVDLHTLHRIQAAMRLNRDLQVNMPGIALVLEMREKLDRMNNELEILRKHITEM